MLRFTIYKIYENSRFKGSSNRRTSRYQKIEFYLENTNKLYKTNAYLQIRYKPYNCVFLYPRDVITHKVKSF